MSRPGTAALLAELAAARAQLTGADRAAIDARLAVALATARKLIAARKLAVVGVVLVLLCGCELYTEDRPELDAGVSVDARPIPDWREAECIALCAPDVGACGPVDECQRSCERAVGAGLPSYCPGGESWRTWECKRLCSSSPGLCPGADQPTCQAECEAWQTNGAYCAGGAP